MNDEHQAGSRQPEDQQTSGNEQLGKWVKPEVREMAAGSAELSFGAPPDLEGMS